MIQRTPHKFRPFPPLPPGSWLGLLGGGQLGRMFCSAAQSVGFRVCVLDPNGDSPAGTVADRHIQADYLDGPALAEFSSLCVAVTTEFENVPARALEILAEHLVVSPAADAVAIAQDRIAEKNFVQECGLAVAPFVEIHRPDDIVAAPEKLFPGVLKISQLRAKSVKQSLVANRDEAQSAFVAMGGVACVLERHLAPITELSVVVARGFDGETVPYPVAENVHGKGILLRSSAPARIEASLAREATNAAVRIAHTIEYVGVLCVEFFVLADGSLVVSELSPRPHNSGHYTIDACVTSQFEQQVRVMAGWPLGGTQQHEPAVMINVLGESWFAGPDWTRREPDWRRVVMHPRAKLHLYGKSDPRPGRKMGHITVMGDSVEQAAGLAQRIADDLSIGGNPPA
jgi:5-(carboxyamino)imidazole ribonucleotide synthase